MDGQQGEAHADRVGQHVAGIGQQGEAVGEQAADDLDDQVTDDQSKHDEQPFAAGTGGGVAVAARDWEGLSHGRPPMVVLAAPCIPPLTQQQHGDRESALSRAAPMRPGRSRDAGSREIGVFSSVAETVGEDVAYVLVREAVIDHPSPLGASDDVTISKQAELMAQRRLAGTDQDSEVTDAQLLFREAQRVKEACTGRIRQHAKCGSQAIRAGVVQDPAPERCDVLRMQTLHLATLRCEYI